MKSHGPKPVTPNVAPGYTPPGTPSSHQMARYPKKQDYMNSSGTTRPVTPNVSQGTKGHGSHKHKGAY